MMVCVERTLLSVIQLMPFPYSHSRHQVRVFSCSFFGSYDYLIAPFEGLPGSMGLCLQPAADRWGVVPTMRAFNFVPQVRAY